MKKKIILSFISTISLFIYSMEQQNDNNNKLTLKLKKYGKIKSIGTAYCKDDKGFYLQVVQNDSDINNYKVKIHNCLIIDNIVTTCNINKINKKRKYMKSLQTDEEYYEYLNYIKSTSKLKKYIYSNENFWDSNNQQYDNRMIIYDHKNCNRRMCKPCQNNKNKIKTLLTDPTIFKNHDNDTRFIKNMQNENDECILSVLKSRYYDENNLGFSLTESTNNNKSNLKENIENNNKHDYAMTSDTIISNESQLNPSINNFNIAKYNKNFSLPIIQRIIDFEDRYKIVISHSRPIDFSEKDIYIDIYNKKTKEYYRVSTSFKLPTFDIIEDIIFTPSYTMFAVVIERSFCDKSISEDEFYKANAYHRKNKVIKTKEIKCFEITKNNGQPFLKNTYTLEVEKNNTNQNIQFQNNINYSFDKTYIVFREKNKYFYAETMNIKKTKKEINIGNISPNEIITVKFAGKDNTFIAVVSDSYCCIKNIKKNEIIFCKDISQDNSITGNDNSNHKIKNLYYNEKNNTVSLITINENNNNYDNIYIESHFINIQLKTNKFSILKLKIFFIRSVAVFAEILFFKHLSYTKFLI